MKRAALRQLLWICIISAVKVEARLRVTSEEKADPFYVNPSYELCEQIQCLRVEDIVNKTVDLWKNPCDDYYKYACSKSYTPNMARQGGHQPFSDDPNQVFNDLRNILEEDIGRKLDQGNDALSIEKRIFKLCKEGAVFSSLEKQYYTQTILPRFGANRLLSEYHYEPYRIKRWDEVDLAYGKKGFGFTFFDVGIYEPKVDTHRRGRYILIKPPSYNIMKLSELLIQYFKKDHFHSRNSKYEKLTKFINDLSPIITSGQNSIESRGSDVTFHRIGDWQERYESHAYSDTAKIDWFNYLRRLFGAAKVPVPDLLNNTFIAVQKEQYFFDLAKTLNDHKEKDAIVDYVHLHFVSNSIGLVDSDYSDYSILPQLKGLPCTPGLLVGTAYRYADEHFPEEDRQLLENMIWRIKNAVVERVERAIPFLPEFLPNHMTKQLMSGFVREYRNAEIYAGYPSWLMNGTNAFSVYGVSTTGHRQQFYDHQEILIENLLRTKLLPLVKPDMPIVDPTELRKGFESSEIEIHSKKIAGSEETKEIVIPFGYFNEQDYRFFSSQLFDPINYGAAATEIAFKLYFDLLSRIDYHKYAPKCIRDEIEMYSKRIRDQVQVPSYARDSIRNEDVRKDVSVTKAVAYLLALEAAYNSWPSKHSYPIQFVDFGAVTDSDLFFLSFAKSLCSIPSKQNTEANPAYLMERERESETDSYRSREHDKIPNYMNFVFQNFKPFLNNYKCQRNHKINEEKDQKECDPLDFSLPLQQ